MTTNTKEVPICQYLKGTMIRDETFTWCTLNENSCLLEAGIRCEEYSKFLDEYKEDE